VYASLHVAAVLCKRDFLLWERSGDTAMKLVEMYNDQQNSSRQSRQWQKERKQWMEHALSAYSAADNLRPPGVDVPCKLARVHIQMGNFIDALTILSSLRKRGSSNMEGSYPCWLLYADLMMKIGFECKQWNERTSSGQSYMARRWLRKHSKIFDWKERRLQALCLALEAAAGSKSCAELSNRMKLRTKQLFEVEKDIGQERNVENEEADTSTDPDGKESAISDGNDQQQDTTEQSEQMSSEPEATNYEEQRSSLVKRNEIELQKFDWKTNSMNLIEGSHGHRDRMAARAALIEKHRESIRELAKRSYNDASQSSEKTFNDSNQGFQRASDHNTDALHLPLQASCATVCQIAALLLTQCVQSKLYEDGLVVARSVLSYYDERVARHKQRLEKRKRYERRSKPAQGSSQPSFEYDSVRTAHSFLPFAYCFCAAYSCHTAHYS
jgi:hypothetical protein